MSAQGPTALDTSVLVAALERSHGHHAVAARYLQEAHDGTRTLVVAAHALAETVSTLTVLPVAPRIPAAMAERLIRESVLPVVMVVVLDGADYAAAIARMAGLGLVNGAVYEALHVQAAEKAGAGELVTINGRDFLRMPPAAPCRLVVL